MEQYAEVIGLDATGEDYIRIASHFKKMGEHFKAGQFYLRAKDYAKVCDSPNHGGTHRLSVIITLPLAAHAHTAVVEIGGHGIICDLHT